MLQGNMVLPSSSTTVGSDGVWEGHLCLIMEGLASEAAVPKTVMIGATDVKTHRTASCLGVKTGGTVA